MSEIKQGYLDFDEYIRQGEPEKRERADAWRVAIGLQAVDGLKTSQYLQDKHRTSTGQAPEQVQDKLHTDNPNIVKLVQVVGEQELSVKEMMDGVGFKGRNNFLNLYLNPAIADGYIRLLFPKSPRHPRQKYLLTMKGLALYNDLNPNLIN